jgi:hypothetical protein
MSILDNCMHITTVLNMLKFQNFALRYVSLRRLWNVIAVNFRQWSEQGLKVSLYIGLSFDKSLGRI